MAYLFDSNTLIEAKNRYYGFYICPAYWDWLLQEREKGQVLSINDVRNELMEVSDELADWAREHTEFFEDIDPLSLRAFGTISQWVMSHAQYRPDAKSSFLGKADARLIAYSKTHGHILVTHEKPEPLSVRSVKIPDVCAAHGVQYMNTFEVLNILHAKFVLESRSRS